MLCPLCGATVSYQGLNTLECVGAGCENYKAPPSKSLDEFRAEFDETPVDWAWFCGFCEWLGKRVCVDIRPERKRSAIGHEYYYGEVLQYPAMSIACEPGIPRKLIAEWLPTSDFRLPNQTMIDYTLIDPIPGTYDHRSGDCETHGANVVFFRAYKSTTPYYCVRCSLEAMSRRYDEELSKNDE